MAISDLNSALEILKRVQSELPKNNSNKRIAANLSCGIVYLEDGINALRLTAHGVKPEFIADEILKQLPITEV